MTYDELNARQYALAYAIAGGEDVPGLLDTVSTEDLVGFIRAERAQERETHDALMSYAAAETREAALREAADICPKGTFNDSDEERVWEYARHRILSLIK